MNTLYTIMKHPSSYNAAFIDDSDTFGMVNQVFSLADSVYPEGIVKLSLGKTASPNISPVLVSVLKIYHVSNRYMCAYYTLGRKNDGYYNRLLRNQF